MPLTHTNIIADDEPAWSSVDKTKLPRVAFAEHGEVGSKSSWGYPHHWVRNGGNEDEDGIYTTGEMYLHTGGWQAAINAAHGARSGQRASQTVIDHLEGHRSAVDTHRESRASIPLLYNDTPQCWANHMGIWVIEPLWMQQAIESIKSGLWRIQIAEREPLQARESPREARTYAVTNGVAVIAIHGPMMKSPSKFGGVGTLAIRQQVRDATKDYDVRTIMLHVDSPGGHVAGTQELADEIFKARSSGKNVVAHIEDLGASGAYWAASQASRITANRTAEVGSIGTVAILQDNSARMERLGVRVHVVSTGPYKGLGVEGSSISHDDLGYVRSRVENLNEHFQSSISRARTLTKKQLAEASDGRVHIAAQAKSMGLLDGIMSFEQALEEACALTYPTEPSRTRGALALDFSTHRRKHIGYALDAFRHRKGV